MGQGIHGSLNHEGIEQARRLAYRLKDEKIHFAYVSDLQRAVHTAKEVLKFHPSAQMILAPQLRERNLGIYEGRPNTEWKEAMQKSPLPFHAFQPAGGESYAQMQKRIGTFFNTVLEKHEHDAVLLVSHTGALAMLLLKILNQPITRENYDTYKPGNTAITIGEVFRERPPIIHLLNSIQHLNSDGRDG